jgi:hypothetical protein
MMQIDQRAWLDVKLGGKELTPLSGQTINLPLTITNSGKTVATKIWARYTVAFINANQGPPLQCVEIQSAGCPVNGEIVRTIMPGKDSPATVLWQSAPGVDRIATPQEVEDWNSGKAYIAIFGIVYYDDVFKVRHWVRFCDWSTKPGTDHIIFQAQSCTQYNSIDGEYPQQNH